MTNSPVSLESSVMRSSVIPSLKYSCSGSLLMLRKGSTAIERLSGSRAGACTSRITCDRENRWETSCQTRSPPPRRTTQEDKQCDRD